MSGLDIGRRFDAKPLLLPWPHCPHMSIGGETGSGKSGLCNSFVGALAELPNVAICGIDLKLVELSPWQDRLTVLAVTPDEADRLLVDLRNLIRGRAQFLQANGHRKWEERFGPWVVVISDELAELQALDADVLADAVEEPDTAQAVLRSGRNGQQVRTALLASLARLARFCGVTIVGATQYPSAEVLDQQIRTQLTIKVMLRVASGEQVNVCLGQGYGSSISPKSIGPSERGGLWIAGLPDSVEPVRARAHWVSDTDVAARVTATRHLTPTYTAVFGGPDTEPMRRPTDMPSYQPSHGDWVAQPRLRVIDEVDAVPSTHAQLEAEPARNVTTTVVGRPPLPFAAIPIPAVLAVSIMGLTVLAVTARALLAVLDGDPRRSGVTAAALVGLVAWCVLLAVPVLVRNLIGRRQRPGIETEEPCHSMAGRTRTAVDARKTDGFAGDAEGLDRQAEHGRGER